jgi:hypothetical protein
MIHPIQWPDIIVGVLIAEGFIYMLRATLHYLANKKRNHLVAQRVGEMRPGTLDNYRSSQSWSNNAPRG